MEETRIYFNVFIKRALFSRLFFEADSQTKKGESK